MSIKSCLEKYNQFFKVKADSPNLFTDCWFWGKIIQLLLVRVNSPRVSLVPKFWFARAQLNACSFLIWLWNTTDKLKVNTQEGHVSGVGKGYVKYMNAIPQVLIYIIKCCLRPCFGGIDFVGLYFLSGLSNVERG